MVPRKKQQLGGVFISLIGSGFIVWSWYTALYNGYFYERASMIFPAFIILGLGLIFFPGYKEERIMRGEDISHVKGMALLTLRWRVILIIALVAGVLNFYMLSSLK